MYSHVIKILLQNCFVIFKTVLQFYYCKKSKTNSRKRNIFVTYITFSNNMIVSAAY